MKRTKKVNIDGPSLKIIPLGGLEQIGMNITAFLSLMTICWESIW